MKFLNTIILAVAAAAVTGIAIAAAPGAAGGNMMNGMSGMMDMMRAMQTTDANGDHMVSKDEFIKAHEAMFDAMRKNQDGLVDMKDMPCA